MDIDWDDAFKKIHKKTTDAGTELGIRMDDSVLTRGLQEGDILFEDADRVIAVRIPPCEVNPRPGGPGSRLYDGKGVL